MKSLLQLLSLLDGVLFPYPCLPEGEMGADTVVRGSWAAAG